MSRGSKFKKRTVGETWQSRSKYFLSSKISTTRGEEDKGQQESVDGDRNQLKNRQDPYANPIECDENNVGI